MSKRGIIEVQFNWIFVLIAGFIIFAFIMSIILNQSKAVNQRSAIEFHDKIVASLKGKQQLSGTYSLLTLTDIEPVKMTFECDDKLKYFDFMITGSQRQELPVEIIFSKETIESNSLQLMVEDFSIPFTASRFMYISTPDTVIVIYNDSAGARYARQLYNDLGPNVTRRFASDENIASKAEGKNVRIVCFDYCPSQYDYINITPAAPGKLYAYGRLGFKRGQSIERSGYISKAALFGAIFSWKKGYYECQMLRAMDQLALQIKLQQAKIDVIQDSIPHNSECYNVLAGPKATLSAMQAEIARASLSDLGELYKQSEYLKIDNKNLLTKSCPTIY